MDLDKGRLVFTQGSFGKAHDFSVDWICVSLLSQDGSQHQYDLLPYFAEHFFCVCWSHCTVFSVFQSAAMEETVIWEQHTVTLHRVGICYPPSDALYISLCWDPYCISLSLPCLFCYLCFHPLSLPHYSLPFSGSHHVGKLLTVYTVAGGTDNTKVFSELHHSLPHFWLWSLDNLHESCILCMFLHMNYTKDQPMSLLAVKNVIF